MPTQFGDEFDLHNEIQIVLKLDLGALDDFAALFSDEKPPTQGNCPQTFTVDRVGVGDY